MNENYLNGLLAELWEQVSSQQFRAVDTTASFSNGTDNASRHPLHLSDVRPPMSVSPTPCDFLKGLAGLIPNVDPSFFVSSQTAASENRDYRPLYSLGGSTVKTRKTLQKMAERKDKREIDPFFWPYAQGTNLFGYDSNGLPIDYVVTAPRKYVARYDVNGNPIYTYDRNLSMGYVTPPKTEEEKRRAEARTEIKNRQRGELTVLCIPKRLSLRERLMSGQNMQLKYKDCKVREVLRHWRISDCSKI